jgi:hypothetical protein
MVSLEIYCFIGCEATMTLLISRKLLRALLSALIDLKIFEIIMLAVIFYNPIVSLDLSTF